MSDPNKPTPPATSGSSMGTKSLFEHLYTTHGPGTSLEPNTQSPGPANPSTTGSTPEKPPKGSSTPQAQTPRPPRTSSGSPPQGSPNLASPTPTATTRTTKPAPQTRSSSGPPRSLFPSSPGTPPRFFDESQRQSLIGPFTSPQAGERPPVIWGAGRSTTPTEFWREAEREHVDRKDLEDDVKIPLAPEWEAYARGLGPFPVKGVYNKDEGEEEENEKKGDKKDEKNTNEKVNENKGK
ncbi:uncharacterized protein F4817DRAFT_368911 [Daldinia loculata]|uniref:uncharacterized protein n=1 Tax=Daldinia loculata TaxID=103429 RepID=UPI0020C29C54|nr:uncharacterized protein F4817DRAFT_368911 [Daldinia loculata]KAI1642869.1 hypothetical protein F4817DRAFT_368911 [Daldinia loculata]